MSGFDYARQNAGAGWGSYADPGIRRLGMVETERTGEDFSYGCKTGKQDLQVGSNLLRKTQSRLHKRRLVKLSMWDIAYWAIVLIWSYCSYAGR